MVAPSRGAVVLVRFPFSDLYGDSQAIRLDAASFAAGSLHVTSFARPGKPFTANQEVMVAEVGALQPEPLRQIIEAVVTLLVGE